MINDKNRPEIQTTLRIDAELHKAIRHFALENNTTLTAIADTALRQWAKEHGIVLSDEKKEANE